MQTMYDRFHFAAAAKTDDLLVCSGQLGVGADGRAIADPPAQFAAAFEAVQAVLAEAGLDFSDVVEMTTFHVGLMQHLGTFMQVKDGYVPETYPAWTAIGVSELAVPGALVEIRATAQLRRPARSKAAPKPRAKKRAAKKKAARRR
jgi:enamine deaminase RidA (YjgF/YER057c/UK114 family)